MSQLCATPSPLFAHVITRQCLSLPPDSRLPCSCFRHQWNNMKRHERKRNATKRNSFKTEWYDCQKQQPDCMVNIDLRNETKCFWKRFFKRTVVSKFSQYQELRSETLGTLPCLIVVYLDPIEVSYTSAVSAEQRIIMIFEVPSSHRKQRQLGVELPDFMVDISRHYSFHAYSLPWPTEEC